MRRRGRTVDRILATAAGMCLGAGLIVITTYIMIGDWM